MQANRRHVVLAAIGAGGLINLALGWLASEPLAGGAGLIGLGYVLLWWMSVRLRRRAKPAAPPPLEPVAEMPQSPEPVDPNNVDALVDQMLNQGRYTLLLRPRVAEGLADEQFHRALAALEEQMALVPDGEVVLGQIDEALNDGKLDDEEILAYQGRVIHVEHFFLDRYPVTNQEYFEFVAAGGYEQSSLWDESILPAVLDFVDTTGQPGPRYWKNGRYRAGQERHPVVGVSWYEAVAYARWLGKRLPTDAEWVKAGSWPVRLSSDSRVMRKYPWGDTMDRARVNLWGSGPGTTVPVDQFPGGVSVGGVYQLIGNVWEWTCRDYRGSHLVDGELALDVPLKSIRGGAFDTYFDNQATCQFQSGESALSRKHNIGVRCAVGVCDLTLARVARQPTTEAEIPSEAPEEVQV